MSNAKLTIILMFNGLMGSSREVASAAVQKRLFELGYKWPTGPGGDGKNLQELRSDRLYVEPVTPDGPRITYSNQKFEIKPFDRKDNETIAIFSALTDTDNALALAAAWVAPIERTIEGVKVVIKHNDVKLDATELLNRVTTEAKRLQAEKFGGAS